jgi:hypothetical protein
VAQPCQSIAVNISRLLVLIGLRNLKKILGLHGQRREDCRYISRQQPLACRRPLRDGVIPAKSNQVEFSRGRHFWSVKHLLRIL